MADTVLMTTEAENLRNRIEYLMRRIEYLIRENHELRDTIEHLQIQNDRLNDLMEAVR